MNLVRYIDLFGLEITGNWSGFGATVTDWEYTGTSAPDDGLHNEGLQSIWGQVNFEVSGILSASVDCKETDDCGDAIREWSLNGAVPVNNIDFSAPLKEPIFPIPGMDAIIWADTIIRTSQFLYKWKDLIEVSGKALLNSPTKICKGSSFLR